MKHPALHTLRTALLLTALSGSAHAALVNGDFSSGLSGWSSLGDVAALHGATLSTASLAVDDAPAAAGAFNTSGVAAAAVGVPGGVEEFAGLGLGALDPDPANGIWAFEGSVLKQSLTVNAGDMLSFDWQFASQEDPLSGMNDYAFVVLDGVLTRLGDVLGGPSGGHFSTALGSAGAMQLAFGIVDVNDYVGTSTLVLSNVRIDAASAVPAPGTLALGLGGLALLRIARRRTA
ncbi:MAG TPA: hypothetical protein PLN96_15165 [Zoogloea sp.]|uniref:hypothetical protein n=1 Tax=Zoogloea sp. TaxID=49181 RepID=UPI002C1A561D|nr:hypothetical protein [Zoogloea sp.]HND25558.1 hypothetical protein [Rhodocyclaceae bacterium]HNI49209.1 hypothetical protein [Zoogloea sp.]